MKNKKNALDLLRPLIYNVLKQESDPGETHVCPNCKGDLRLSIKVYTEIDSIKKLGVGAYCDNCKITASFEFGDSDIPPWAEESKDSFNSIKDALEHLGNEAEES